MAVAFARGVLSTAPWEKFSVMVRRNLLRKFSSTAEPQYVELERHFTDGVKLLSAMGVFGSIAVGTNKMFMNQAMEGVDTKLAAMNMKMEAMNTRMKSLTHEVGNVVLLVWDIKGDQIVYKSDMRTVEGNMKNLDSKMDTLLARK